MQNSICTRNEKWKNLLGSFIDGGLKGMICVLNVMVLEQQGSRRDMVVVEEDIIY